MNNRASQLQTALESTKQKVNEELQNKKVYEHMLSRMKKDHISMEV